MQRLHQQPEAAGQRQRCEVRTQHVAGLQLLLLPASLLLLLLLQQTAPSWLLLLLLCISSVGRSNLLCCSCLSCCKLVGLAPSEAHVVWRCAVCLGLCDVMFRSCGLEVVEVQASVAPAVPGAHKKLVCREVTRAVTTGTAAATTKRPPQPSTYTEHWCSAADTISHLIISWSGNQC